MRLTPVTQYPTGEPYIREHVFAVALVVMALDAIAGHNQAGAVAAAIALTAGATYQYMHYRISRRDLITTDKET